MKKIILGLLVLSSTSTFAATKTDICNLDLRITGNSILGQDLERSLLKNDLLEDPKCIAKIFHSDEYNLKSGYGYKIERIKSYCVTYSFSNLNGRYAEVVVELKKEFAEPIMHDDGSSTIGSGNAVSASCKLK